MADIMDATLREVVLRSPVTVSPTTTIADAERFLIAALASDVYVIDDHERLLGVVPDYEFLKHRLNDGAADETVRSLMCPVAVSLGLNASLDAAARLLRENIRASVPVLEGGRLIGQLCRGNLLRILAEQSAQQPTQDFAAELQPRDELPAAIPAPHFAALGQAVRVLTTVELE